LQNLFTDHLEDAFCLLLWLNLPKFVGSLAKKVSYTCFKTYYSSGGWWF